LADQQVEKIDRETLRKIENQRWRTRLFVSLLLLILAGGILVLLQFFDYFGLSKLGILWNVYKVLLGSLILGFVVYLTYVEKREQVKTEAILEQVLKNSSRLEEAKKDLSYLNECMTRLFRLKEVSGLTEFLQTIISLLSSDGGIILFGGTRDQILVETPTKKAPPFQSALVDAFKRVYSRGETSILHPSELNETFSPSDLLELPEKISLVTAPLKWEGELMGLVGFWREKGDCFSQEDFNLLQAISLGAEVAMSNAYLLNEKEDMLRGLAEELLEWIESRSPFRKGHGREVAYWAGRIAEQLGLPDFETREIRLAALLHDIGFGGVEESILEKPGPLSEEERRVVESHVKVGASVLKKAKFPERVIYMVLYHHEKCNGSGYPQGLKKDQIPLGARIIAVADTFDALTHRRAYRDAKDLAKAIQIIKKGIPNRFDPEVVKAFLEIHKEESLTASPMPQVH
jgi:putative nucleotidyltransferase with HDIG domain